jgi:hypothetical protein
MNFRRYLQFIKDGKGKKIIRLAAPKTSVWRDFLKSLTNLPPSFIREVFRQLRDPSSIEQPKPEHSKYIHHVLSTINPTVTHEGNKIPYTMSPETLPHFWPGFLGVVAALNPYPKVKPVHYSELSTNLQDKTKGFEDLSSHYSALSEFVKDLKGKYKGLKATSENPGLMMRKNGKKYAGYVKKGDKLVFTLHKTAIDDFFNKHYPGDGEIKSKLLGGAFMVTHGA